MRGAELERVRVPRRRGRHPGTERLWREWCFARATFAHFRVRIALLLFLLIGGGLLFRWLEPERQHSLLRAIYCTWSLIFGEPPEEFPRSPVLQAMFFLVPLLGLLVIVEAIVEFALLLRDRRRNERSWCKTMAESMCNHIILVGLGKLGFRIFGLLRRLGERVVVIERNPENQFLAEVRQDGAPLLIGDARREALLAEANAAKARSVIVAADDDLTNLEVALDARRLNPEIRVVLRMFDQNMADKIRDGFNLRTAMSQSAISAPAFAMAAVDGSIVSSTIVHDQLVVTQRWHVRPDGPLCTKTVGDVMQEFGVGIVSRRSGADGALLMPPPGTRLVAGDELLVQGTFEVLSKLRAREDVTGRR